MGRPSLALAGLLAGLCTVGACKRQRIDAPCLPGAGYAVEGRKHELGATVPTHDPDSDVVVRPLGAAGLYVQWRGNAVLISPYFTGYPVGGAAAGRRVSPDKDAIAAGLAKIDRSAVQAILVGSSAYERLSDVVAIAEQLPNADVFVNQSGRNIMAGHVATLEGRSKGAKKVRVRSMDGDDRPRLAGQAVWLRGADGTEIPIRVRAFPLPTPDPEPQAEIDVEWSRVRLGDFFEGRRHAFVIDLFDATRDNSMFRMLVVGSGSEPSMGEAGGTTEFDLVAVGLRMYAVDENDPTGLLTRMRAAHVMFFDYTTSDVKGRLALHEELDREWIGETLCSVDRALSDTGLDERAPRGREGAMHGKYWTMPLPGQWMVMSAALEGAAGEVASDPLVEARDAALAKVNDLDLDGAQQTLAAAAKAAKSGGRAQDPMLAPVLALQAAVIHSNTANVDQTKTLLQEAVGLDYYVSIPIELRTAEVAAILSEVQSAVAQPGRPVIVSPPKRNDKRGLVFKALVQVPLPEGAQIVLYWRKVGAKEYQSVTMHRFGNVATGLVGATEHRGADVEYFIYAFDSAYKPLASEGDRDNPSKAFAG